MRNHKSQKPQTWTVLDALQWTAGFFDSRHIDAPRLTAELLLSEVLGVDRIDLYIRHDQPLSETELSFYREMIRRRIRREPVAYILGTREFWGLPFRVTPDVLIPRPETEHLVEAVLSRLPAEEGSPRRVIDMGTGSGAVAVSLATEHPDNLYFAVDLSYNALCVARQNALQNGVSDRVHFFASHWLDAVDPEGPGFDIIVSNPPYIPTDSIPHLEPEVSRYEPRLALDGKKQGLEALGLLICRAPAYLVSCGFLIVEIGWDQKGSVDRMYRKRKEYGKIEFIKDYAGHDRVAVLQKA